jgi:hypothetical protein
MPATIIHMHKVQIFWKKLLLKITKLNKMVINKFETYFKNNHLPFFMGLLRHVICIWDQLPQSQAAQSRCQYKRVIFSLRILCGKQNETIINSLSYEAVSPRTSNLFSAFSISFPYRYCSTANTYPHKKTKLRINYSHVLGKRWNQQNVH